MRDSSDDMVIFFATNSDMRRFILILESMWQTKNVSFDHQITIHMSTKHLTLNHSLTKLCNYLHMFQKHTISSLFGQLENKHIRNKSLEIQLSEFDSSTEIYVNYHSIFHQKTKQN